MLRKISISVRRLQTRKEIKKTISLFKEWKHQIEQIPANRSTSKKILIIRLDDIGDYLLFRNTLTAYRNSPKWAGYEITLLGNVVWKDLYNYADIAFSDKNIWIDKHQYFRETHFREELWTSLRNEGFEVVICPSHSRPLLLDDMCMLATGAAIRIASENDFQYQEWNKLSDNLYPTRYHNNKLDHELYYNRGFANWCCDAALAYNRPHITPPATAVTPKSEYIICFIGASKQSKLWFVNRWIELINICSKESKYELILAGGKGDKEIADAIVKVTNTRNIVGEVSLVEIIDWIANAKAVITNDTMTPHLAISCGTPTVIVANGVNFYKFCAYKEAGISDVASVYPEAFMHIWKSKNFSMFRGYLAVTKDISTIRGATVFSALKMLLHE